MNSDQRPNPDSLLNIVNNDRSISSRGRLKVFFGASAGVGKTYAMLVEAHRKRAEGLDIVIGTIESHGRTETAELIDGLPMIEPRKIVHRGITLTEFNLEAALERKPSIILMDEFAHSNAPGSRHPKRWQDVDELLSNGIDVYTTLNVQHLESINDMVAKLTGIIVRETVPDSIFDSADEISLIDLPSDELLKRLHEGKVYIAEGADKRAAQNFFKKTNLVALREMALRRTADRVDAENDSLNAAQGHKEAQLAQKILVCVGHDSLSTRVIRHAKRMAVRGKAFWAVVYVETGRHERLSEKAKLTVDQNLRLAEKMGARIVRLTGDNAVDEILNYARDNGFTRIVAGHKKQLPFIRIFQGSLFKNLIENGTGFEVTVVTENTPSTFGLDAIWGQFGFFSHYILALVGLAIATMIGMVFRNITDIADITMIYITAVVFIAAKLGTAPSIFASFGSVLAFNFFFTRSSNMYDPRYTFTFLVMFLTSLTVGSLAARLSLQANQARKRAAETSILYALTRELSSVRGFENMALASSKHLSDAFKMEAVVLYEENGVLKIIPEDSPVCALKEESVIRWILDNGQNAGRSTDTMPSAKGFYVPLSAEEQILGVIGLIPKTDDYQFTSGEISQMETFSSLIASALQRAKRANDAEHSKIISENEKLRNILLSSISHDLRTPLAGIIGAVSNAQMLKSMIPQQLSDLLDIIHTQSTRLAKLVTNLLDATSLETGTVPLNKEIFFIHNVVKMAFNRIGHQTGNRVIDYHIPENLPPTQMDGLLIEQIIVNLLDNAIHHTPDEGHIIIQAEQLDNFLSLSVCDNGHGLPAGDEEKVFEKFYTKTNHTQGNSGLGLAICRSIIMAHGGQIFAKNQEHGVKFTFTLPITE